MITRFLRFIGVYVYLKYLRKRYWPTPSQLAESRSIGEKVKFYRHFMQPGDLCFDVGANIGNRTEAFLQLGARVVAVEPQPECAQMLRLRFGKKIFVVEKALGERESEGIIYQSDSSEISSMSKNWIEAVSKTRFKNRNWSKALTVKVTTLDVLITQYGRPVFCKIDVEGFEEQVLKGLSVPISFLSFEYTVPEQLVQIISCLSILSKTGTYDCNYSKGEDMRLELAHWISPSELMDRLNSVSEELLFGDIYIRFKV